MNKLGNSAHDTAPEPTARVDSGAHPADGPAPLRRPLSVAPRPPQGRYASRCDAYGTLDPPLHSDDRQLRGSGLENGLVPTTTQVDDPDMATLEPDPPQTPQEAAFLAQLLSEHPNLDVWQHTAADGRPWLIVSRDFSVDGGIRDTLRLDFDGNTIKGGWSPACLNWDDGVPATEAEIDLSPPDGIDLTSNSIAQLAITLQPGSVTTNRAGSPVPATDDIGAHNTHDSGDSVGTHGVVATEQQIEQQRRATSAHLRDHVRTRSEHETPTPGTPRPSS